MPPFREQDIDTEKVAMSNTRRKLRSCRLNFVDELKLPKSEEIKQESGNISRYFRILLFISLVPKI